MLRPWNRPFQAHVATRDSKIAGVRSMGMALDQNGEIPRSRMAVIGQVSLRPINSFSVVGHLSKVLSCHRYYSLYQSQESDEGTLSRCRESVLPTSACCLQWLLSIWERVFSCPRFHMLIASSQHHDDKGRVNLTKKHSSARFGDASRIFGLGVVVAGYRVFFVFDLFNFQLAIMVSNMRLHVMEQSTRCF